MNGFAAFENFLIKSWRHFIEFNGTTTRDQCLSSDFPVEVGKPMKWKSFIGFVLVILMMIQRQISHKIKINEDH